MSDTNLILLIGTSSAGKSSVAQILQRSLDAHYLYMGIDNFFKMVNPDWGGGSYSARSKQIFYYERDGEFLRIRYGPLGLSILRGIQGTVKSMLMHGNNLIFDDMLMSEEQWNLWRSQRAIEHYRTFICSLQASPDVLKEREQRRGRKRRYWGLALGHVEFNDPPDVDYRIYTDDLTAGEVAAAILDRFERIN